MFSLGLVPVNTYADPGFKGRLGIVMINASNDYLAVPALTPIAKIEFVQLEQAVDKPYSGQHGYETEIWPIPSKFKLTAAEIAADPRINGTVEEVERAYGRDFGTVVRRVFRYERRILLGAGVYFLVLIGVLGLSVVREDRLNVWLSVGLGVIGNAIFVLITWLATSVRRKR
jgi:dCTP deaminase